MTAIRAIAEALPALEISNADLARANPSWQVDQVAELVGVRSRRIVADGETAFDLSLQASERLFAEEGLDPADIDAILYCTQTPDHPLPGNAHLLHERLELSDETFALDYTMGCSGFVYGLALADALARSGSARQLLLVVAETALKRTNPGDRSVRMLLGDGAAAAHITADGPGGATIVASQLATHGRGFKQGYVPAGGARKPATAATKRETADGSGNVRTDEDFYMDGTGLWSFVNSTVSDHIRAFLSKRSLALEDIDLYVFHQASRVIVSSLGRSLGLPREKVFSNLEHVGNLSSASIPVALRAALDQGAINPGDRVLLTAFGTGISYGSVLLEY